MDTGILHKLNDLYFETGPIRPPSEAYSLLIRATRNCSWNRCSFCPVYKGQKFELRTAGEVISDIHTARLIADVMKEFGWINGYGDHPREIAAYIYNQASPSACVRQVALWQYAGGTSAFLQDANSIIMRTPDLVKILRSLMENFTSLNRITSYCRSKTAAKKTVDEFREMKEAGLTRIHVGMESGADPVLEFMDKGMTAEDHMKGGVNIREAGIELSEYYMPGLGGRQWSTQHASDSARVLSEVNPDFIRLRTLHVSEIMPLWQKQQAGEFDMLSEDETVSETGLFMEKLNFSGELKSDHILNLLPELEGKFPEAKAKCLDTISRYLAMPLKERFNFRLGRRAGLYERLIDIFDAAKYQKVDEAMQRIGGDYDPARIDQAIEQLKMSFL